jgi:NADPH:quinone reductase-like Zn-dependent oxidoreductase
VNQKIVFKQAGGPDKLALEEAPDCAPGPGEVRILVLATGVAFGDIMLRRGLAGGRFPVTPGYDLVGVVDALGAGATAFKLQDRVAALPGTGALQQSICLSESELVAVPAAVSSEKAAALILNYVTAYQLLVRAAALKTEDSAFIYGIAGGLGSAMVDIARVLGIRLYGTASGKRADAARQQGAVVFDRSNPQWPDAARTENPSGYDAVFDPLGGASLNRSYRLLAPKGVLVMLGAATAVQGEGNGLVKILDSLARFVALKLHLDSRKVRLFVITQSKKSWPAEFQADLVTLFDWLAQGKIDPAIGLSLPLKDAAQAYHLLERSEVLGKIVLIP